MKKLFSVTLIVTTMVLISCVDKTPLSEENQIYAGIWQANDGTWIQVFNDGGGDFQLSNSSVSGGSVTITDSTLEIGLMGMAESFALSVPPYEKDGQWILELNGIPYVKQ